MLLVVQIVTGIVIAFLILERLAEWRRRPIESVSYVGRNRVQIVIGLISLVTAGLWVLHLVLAAP